jgi:hypothetical protein
VVSSKDIIKSGLDWASIDNFILGKDAQIINTDVKNGDGIHWIVLLRLKNDTLFIFDPLGPKNELFTSFGPAESILINRAKSQGIKYIVKYPKKVQLDESFHCGQFSQLIAKVINEYLDGHQNASPNEIIKVIDEFFKIQRMPRGGIGNGLRANEKMLKKYF